MTRHGTDKGQGRHNYTIIYSSLFGKLRNQPLRVYELGLGTNNPTLVSSMGEGGFPGASLRGWRDFFPHALVFGADIDQEVLFEDDRIRTFYCDQLNSAAIRDLWSQPSLRTPLDIIIDDGLHTFEGNVSFLSGSLERIRPGGIYIVEDILEDTIKKWHTYLEDVCSRQFPDYDFAFVELADTFNRYDNNLLVVRRRE
ncbi:MAG: hypothetical protein ABSD67_05945 [Terracidiphilus sp.]|jgi:hypothetical protein